MLLWLANGALMGMKNTFTGNNGMLLFHAVCLLGLSTLYVQQFSSPQIFCSLCRLICLLMCNDLNPLQFNKYNWIYCSHPQHDAICLLAAITSDVVVTRFESYILPAGSTCKAIIQANFSEVVNKPVFGQCFCLGGVFASE